MNANNATCSFGMAVLSLALMSSWTCAVEAGESYDNCTGFVDSVPATITSAGTWCLRGSRFTGQASGAAITIAADNVTVDCNGFRISALSVPQGSQAIGVIAPSNRHRTVVRRCRIQGFKYGVQLLGDHSLVEDNTIQYSQHVGIYVAGDGPVVRDNRVTGVRSSGAYAYGIYAVAPVSASMAAQVLDNSIDGAGSDAAEPRTRGIVANGRVQGNFINGIVPISIQLVSGGLVADNVVSTPGYAGAIRGSGQSTSICRNNTIVAWSPVSEGFAHFGHCSLSGQNLIAASPPE